MIDTITTFLLLTILLFLIVVVIQSIAIYILIKKYKQETNDGIKDEEIKKMIK